MKMKSVDPDTGFNIKKIFPERDIIFKFKILFEFLWFKDEFFLYKISDDGKCGNSADDIPDKRRQDLSFGV